MRQERIRRSPRRRPRNDEPEALAPTVKAPDAATADRLVARIDAVLEAAR